MSEVAPTLHMLCGKIASGKSTLAAKLAEDPGVIVIAEDAWLNALFGDQMQTIADYVRCTAKLRGVMGAHIEGILRTGVSVVLDFQANTVESRAWMLDIAKRANTVHQLHVLEVSDEECLERLHKRNAEGIHPFAVTDEQFRQMSRHFIAPSPDEGFTIVRH